MEYWCGPSYLEKFWLGRVLKKHLSRRHNNICQIHDTAYTNKEGNRDEVDMSFLIMTVTNSFNQSPSGFIRAVYVMEDCIYYCLIHLFGRNRWGKK